MQMVYSASTNRTRFNFIVSLLDVKKPLSGGGPGVPARLRCGRARRPSLHLLFLFFVYEVSAAILLIATFVRLGAERFLVARADGLDSIATHSSLDEPILHRVRAVGAESQVIFGRAALVAVSLNSDVNVGMLLKELRIALQRALLIRAYIIFVVIEVDVLYVSGEKLLFRSVGGRGRSGCGVNGYASGGFLASAGSLSDEMVGG